jgi:predicted aspartyl protease
MRKVPVAAAALIALSVAVASALPAWALADVSECGDLFQSWNSVGATYDAVQTRIGQFKQSHGMPLGGGDDLAQYDLSIHELTSYGKMLRDEVRNTREMIALAKSVMDNGCLQLLDKEEARRRKKEMRRWFVDAPGWMQAAAPTLAYIDARLTQMPGGASPPSLSPPTGASGETVVQLVSEGGTFRVPVAINGQLTLKFTVDSGAADVSIPADVVMTLVRTGTISDADFLGKQTYTLADGSTIPSQRFVIRSLKVGDKTLENVIGSIAPLTGGLLLGQSFLSRFQSWSMDNQRQALVLR